MSHNGCPEHWRNDLRRSNATLNDMSFKELIECFEPFNFPGKKNHKSNKKKDNKTVQFKNENSKNKFFYENHGHNPTHNTKQCES